MASTFTEHTDETGKKWNKEYKGSQMSNGKYKITHANVPLFTYDDDNVRCSEFSAKHIH